jgi:hypothetical protein
VPFSFLRYRTNNAAAVSEQEHVLHLREPRGRVTVPPCTRRAAASVSTCQTILVHAEVVVHDLVPHPDDVLPGTSGWVTVNSRDTWRAASPITWTR